MSLADLADPRLLNQYELNPNGDFDKPAIEDAVEVILRGIGEDPDRDGLLKTPHRVAKMYGEVLAGYTMDPEKVINNAVFDVEYQEMVLVKDIEFYSMCEHHMLPFFGHVHVAYIPDGKVIGLSKIPRIVDMFAKRLQVQERMTQQIANFLMDVINPCGVGVVIEGMHMCATMRGVEKKQAKMVTSALTGQFRDNEKTRAEFLSFVPRPTGGGIHP